VSLSLRAGETLGIVGESGCGKSTMGRMVLRVLEPTAGRIRFEGQDITRLQGRALRAIRPRMQMVFQDPYASLNPKLRVGEIIAEPLIVNLKTPERRCREKVDELLEVVGLKAEDRFRYPHEFSGGQRQRVGIARALALHPGLIVADEAVSALDVSIQSQILNLFVDLRKRFNLSYIFISHNLAVIRHLSDRIGVMYLGRLVEMSPKADLFNQPLHPYTEALLSAALEPTRGTRRERMAVRSTPGARSWWGTCAGGRRPSSKKSCRGMRSPAISTADHPPGPAGTPAVRRCPRSPHPTHRRSAMPRTWQFPSNLTLALATWLAAGGIPMAAAAPPANQTLLIAMSSDNTGLDPATVSNNDSGYIMSAIYDGLIAYKPGSTEICPGLSDTWKVSKDGLTYTFHLRQGIKFHDGTPFNADAVVKWLDRMLNKDNPNFYAKRPGTDSYVDFTFPGVDSWRKVDAADVAIHMAKPNAEFLNSMAMVWMGVASPTAVEKYGLDYYKHPVGTGPFKFGEWVANDHVTLVANQEYWRGKPKLGKVTYRVIPESAVRVMELLKGTVDVIADITPLDAKTLMGNANVHIMSQPGLMVSGVALPTLTKPFDDPKVRKALNYAIDKDMLCKYLFKGLATPMTSPLPPTQWGYDKTLPGYPYDPAKAKQLLASAGYPDGFTADLYIYPGQKSYNPVGGPDLAQFLQNQLKKIGVTIKIQQLESGALFAKVHSKDFTDMALAGWSGDNGDPDNFVGSLWASSQIPSINTARYTSKPLDELLARALEATDVKKRVELYKQTQKIIMDDAPWIFLNYATQLRAEATRVKGLVLDPTCMFFGMEQVSK
jgi:peptide/nickel transport system substrate-binding protein